MVLCGVLFLSTAVSGDEFSPDSIKSIMRKVAKYTFQQYGGGTAAGINHDWDGGTIMTGVTGLYLATKEQQWLDSIDKWGNRWNWTWGGGTGDNLCCIQTFCERYIVDSVPANASKYQVSKTALDGILKQQVNHLFGWQDAVYMGLPDFAMMGDITGNPMYFDSLNSMFRGAEKDFQDPVYKLWYWSTAASFKTTPKGHPQFWGPGNAWVLGGLVRSLKYLPKNSPYRPAWLATFKTFCDTLRIKQQADGFWRTSLFEPTEFPNPESSCTAFFAYAMSLGVSWGILDTAAFIPVIRKAWSALVKAVDVNGRVGYGQPWSNQPGSPTFGNSIPEGHGAFLLAGQGVGLIAGISTPVVNGNRDGKQETKAACGVGKWVNISGMNRSISIPEGAKGLEVYDIKGERLWRTGNCGGRNLNLPSSIAKGGICYIKFF